MEEPSLSYSITGNGLEPVVVEIEKKHLWFSCLQDQVTKLFNFQTGLEWELQLASFDDNIREVKQVNLKIKKV